MKRIYQSLLTQYRREIAVSSAVLASLLIVGRLAPIGSHEVVVASRNIPVGSQLTPHDLTTASSRTWPNEVTDPAQLIGQTLNHSIPSGGLITTSDVVGDAVSIDGKVQTAISISTIDSAMISSGSHIDIYSATGVVAVDAVVVSVRANHASGILGSDVQSSAIVAISASEVPQVAAAKDGSGLTIALR